MTAITLGTVGASKPATPTPTPATVSTSGTVVTPAGTADFDATGKRKTKLGINLSIPSYVDGTRAFMNLVSGSPWWLGTNSGSLDMPLDRLDGDGNVVKLNSGEYAMMVISPPTKAFRGTSVDVICRWTGKGTVSVSSVPVQNPKVSTNSLTFTFVPQGNYGALFKISKSDPTDPVRKIDCREADANVSTIFDPTFLQEVQRYSTIRFMKWQPSVESNAAVTWATRTTLNSAIYRGGSDGIAIEYMVMLANQTKKNPWFCMPWNADDDYIRKFAEYVRDNLDPSLVAYVETSNEVWNWGYKVTAQARDEGMAKNLASDQGTALLYRYAERTGEVMNIWSSVFAGKMSRIVRVAATQNAVPWAANTVLGFKDTASKVDALATAPYFDYNFAAGALATSGLDGLFATTLTNKVDNTLSIALQNKAIATGKGLRYITYEAGQHVTSATDIPMLTQIERDPRMGKLYTRYLTKWKNEIGDLMILFADYGRIDQYGAWGQQEYVGQPLSDAPKAQAVELFRQSYLMN